MWYLSSMPVRFPRDFAGSASACFSLRFVTGVHDAVSPVFEVIVWADMASSFPASYSFVRSLTLSCFTAGMILMPTSFTGFTTPAE